MLLSLTGVLSFFFFYTKVLFPRFMRPLDFTIEPKNSRTMMRAGSRRPFVFLTFITLFPFFLDSFPSAFTSLLLELSSEIKPTPFDICVIHTNYSLNAHYSLLSSLLNTRDSVVCFSDLVSLLKNELCKLNIINKILTTIN